MSEGIQILPTPNTPEHREAVRRHNLRSNYLVPIYVMNTSNVPTEEAQAGFQGVMDAARASGQRREVVNFGSERWVAGDYGSSDWYVEEAFRRQQFSRNLGHGPQLVTRSVTRLFIEEPWQQNPHWEVFIVNRDLTSGEPDNNFVFGETNVDLRASVQSVTRLMNEVPRGQLRLSMIRRLLAHEVGHMFGLPGRNYRVEQKLGLHCINICCMRQGMSIPEWAQLTQQEERSNIKFCNDCLNDLGRSAPRFRPLISTASS